MNLAMKEMLTKLAARECLTNNEVFDVGDYGSCDAYGFGVEDGETTLARELLKKFGDT